MICNLAFKKNMPHIIFNSFNQQNKRATRQ